MIKVLEILKNFFQEVFKQGLGQSPKVLGLGQSPKVFPYHFYPVAERVKTSKSRWTGFGSKQPEITTRQTATPKSVPRKNRAQNPIGLKF